MGDKPYRNLSINTELYTTEFEPVRKTLEKRNGTYVSMPEAVKVAMRLLKKDLESGA